MGGDASGRGRGGGGGQQKARQILEQLVVGARGARARQPEQPCEGGGRAPLRHLRRLLGGAQQRLDGQVEFGGEHAEAHQPLGGGGGGARRERIVLIARM